MPAMPSTFQPPERLDKVQPLYLRHVRDVESQCVTFWRDVAWPNSLPASIFSFELVSREGFLRKLLPEEARSLVEPTLRCLPRNLFREGQERHAYEDGWTSEGERPSHWQPLDPEAMKRLFELLLQRLQREREQLPLVHRLYEWTAGKRFAGPTGLCAICESDSPEVRMLEPVKPLAEGENPDDEDEDLPLFLQGWHKDLDHRHDLRVWDVSPESTEAPEFRPRGWRRAEKRFTFGDADVEVETQYAVDFFRPEVEKVLQHCRKAARMGVPIYWLSDFPKEA